MHTRYAHVKRRSACPGRTAAPSTLARCAAAVLLCSSSPSLLAGGVHAGGRRPASTPATTDDDGSTRPTPPTSGDFTPEPIEWDDCGGGGVRHPRRAPRLRGSRRRADRALRRPDAGQRRAHRRAVHQPRRPRRRRRRVRRVLAYVLPEEITEHFDIVGIDPRGVGGSTPIDCGVPADELYGADPTFEDAADEEALPRDQRGVRRRLRGEVRRPPPARRHAATSRATWTSCGPPWATSSSATSATATAP